MRSIAQDSFEQIKVYAPGVDIDAADAARALSLTNQMLGEWANEKLVCFANLEQSFPLVPGDRTYTIGTGGDINKVRPLKIETGPGIAYLLDSSSNRFEIEVIEQDEWNQIKLLTVTAQYPNKLFYDPQYPLGIINIFPTPETAHTVYFDSRLKLASMNALDTAFSLPDGYAQAIKSNLSVRLWRYYKQGAPDQDLKDEASNALAAIRRTNLRQSPVQYDTAIVNTAARGYNIQNDS